MNAVPGSPAQVRAAALQGTGVPVAATDGAAAPPRPGDAPVSPLAIGAHTRLEDFIVQLPGALPQGFCAALLGEYAASGEWTASRTGDGAVRRDLRHADNIQLSHDGVIARNRAVRQRLNDALVRHTAAALKHYIARYPHFRITQDTGFELLRYPEGGFFRQHTDAYHEVQRALACSYLLDDAFEGGAFAFFDRGRTYTLRKGDALLFPANFMYPHEVLPVTRGVRYAIVTWFI